MCTFAPRVEEHSHETAKNPYMRMLPLNTAVVERNGHSYVASTITLVDLFTDIPVGSWGTPNLEVLILSLIGDVEDLQDTVYELETELANHGPHDCMAVEDKLDALQTEIDDHSHEVSFN